MQITTTCRIEPGREYTYHVVRAMKRDEGVMVEDVDLGRYRVLGFALDGQTLRELVLVEGLDGWEQGRWLVYTLADFAAKFRPAPEPVPDQPPEEKTIGRIAEPWRTGA